MPNSRTSIPARQDYSFSESRESTIPGLGRGSSSRRNFCAAKSIKPLITWIKLRQYNDQNCHSPHSTMADTRRNHDALTFTNRDDFSVEFHLSIVITLEEEICLSQRLVIVPLRIFRDFCHMDRARKFRNVTKRAARCSTWAGYSRDFCKISPPPPSNHKICRTTRALFTPPPSHTAPAQAARHDVAAASAQSSSGPGLSPSRKPMPRTVSISSGRPTLRRKRRTTLSTARSPTSRLSPPQA